MCPSCHQKRTLLTALHVAEEVCFPVSNRQVVLTIPKRLQMHTRFDWRLLGKLSFCACTCLKVEAGHMLDHGDVTPGTIVAIQTHGKLLHWHPHIHVLLTYGAFLPKGEFLELPQFDMERFLVTWQEVVFALYLAEERVESEVVEDMRTWQHCGLECRPVGVSDNGQSGRYRAFDPVHDSLSFQDFLAD